MWRKATVSEEPRKRVAIIGAGASGMAAAWSLARFPDKFDVTVIEASEDCGGVACTLDHQGTKINYGVQGGSPAAHSNTVELMKTFGFDVGPTKLDVSFGLGEYNWKNYESKPLQQRLVKETRRFGDVLKWVSRLECVTIFISIDFLLKSLNFSEDFRHRMVYPLVALFFGTGNQTPVRAQPHGPARSRRLPSPLSPRARLAILAVCLLRRRSASLSGQVARHLRLRPRAPPPTDASKSGAWRGALERSRESARAAHAAAQFGATGGSRCSMRVLAGF